MPNIVKKCFAYEPKVLFVLRKKYTKGIITDQETLSWENVEVIFSSSTSKMRKI